MAKKIKSFQGLVYSTNPEAMKSPAADPGQATPQPGDQKLTISLDKKQRAGKTVTLIQGFEGKEEDLAALGKKIKAKCGAGGTVKDGLILIQGDYRLRIEALLRGWGYGLT